MPLQIEITFFLIAFKLQELFAVPSLFPNALVVLLSQSIAFPHFLISKDLKLIDSVFFSTGNWNILKIARVILSFKATFPMNKINIYLYFSQLKDHYLYLHDSVFVLMAITITNTNLGKILLLIKEHILKF